MGAGRDRTIRSSTPNALLAAPPGVITVMPPGVDVNKLISIPTLSNNTFPKAKKFVEHGLHNKRYTFSPDAYREAGLIWNSSHPEYGSPLAVVPGAIKGVPYPVLEEEPQLNLPGENGFDPEMFTDIASRPGPSTEWKQRSG